MWTAILRDALIAAAFALVLWTPLGRWILSRLGLVAPGWSLPLAVGTGAWGLVILGLGLLGGLYSLLVLAVGVIVFGSLRLHRRLLPEAGAPPETGSRPARVPAAILGAVGAVFVLLVLASAPAPETAFDSLNVHLPYARDAAASHRIGLAPNNWSSLMPALPLMSYVTAFLFSGLTLAKLFNVLAWLACGGVAWCFARRWWGRLHGVTAALLVWSSPVALYEATTALIDLPLALYSAVAVFSLLEWSRTGEKPWLRLSAVGLGLALGCKYHAAFWAAPLGGILLWHATRVRGVPLRRAAVLLLEYALIAALLFAPWAIRSWAYSGNPVFPVANTLFQSPFFTPAMDQAARAAYENQGVGRSWSALAALPWTVSFHPGPFRGSLGFFFLPGLLLALARRKTPEMRYALIAVPFYFYSWALSAQEIRYLLPLAPLLALITAGAVWGFRPEPREEGVSPVGRLLPGAAARPAVALLVAAAALSSLPGIYSRWVSDWTYWHSYRRPFRYLAGREPAQEFLRHDVPSIYVYDYINRHLDSGDRVLLLNDASQFYSRVPTLYSFTLEGEELLLQETEAGVLRRLKESAISHVLLNYNGIAPLPGVAPRKGVYFFLDRGFQERHLEEVFARNNVVLYRVRGS